jgi:hypothetical protein
LQNFAADWKPSSWVVTSLKCQGPDGVDQFAATQAEAQLRSINPFLDAIKNAISSQLASLGTSPIAFTFNVAMGDEGAPVSLTLKPETFTAIPNDRVNLDGTADFSFPGLGQCDPPKNEDLKLASASPLIDQSGDALFLPFGIINRVIECGYKTPGSRVKIRSSSIPALDSLLSNPFAELVVWPDLLRFGFHTVLELAFGMTSPATIGIPTRVSQGVIDANLVLPMLVSVNAPTAKGGFTHYVDLTTNLNGPSHWVFKGNNVTIQQRVEDVKIGSSWDQTYVHHHHDLEAINTGLFEGKFKDFLFEQGITYSIPNLVLNQSLTLKTTDVDYGDGDLRIGIKMVSTPSTAPAPAPSPSPSHSP